MVELETQRGEPIIRLQLPPFVDLPSVLVWGDRIFLKTNGNRYQEVTFWVVPQLVRGIK